MFSHEQRVELAEYIAKYSSDDFIDFHFGNGKQAGFIVSFGFDCALYLTRFKYYLPMGFQVSDEWVRDKDLVTEHCDSLLAEIYFDIIDNADGESDYRLDWEGRSYA